MSDDPLYEIWGLDDTPSDMDGGHGHHREDFCSFAEAKAALSEWQSGGRAAWIVVKGDQDAAYGRHRQWQP